MNKFKPYQNIMIKDFMCNGSVMDIGGMVEGYTRTKQNKVIVIVNSVRMYLPEDKLIDYNEYWANKKKEKA